MEVTGRRYLATSIRKAGNHSTTEVERFGFGVKMSGIDRAWASQVDFTIASQVERRLSTCFDDQPDAVLCLQDALFIRRRGRL